MKRDLRRYAQGTHFRLALGAFILLFIVGLGLIYLLYGRGAAAMGLLCLMAGLAPVLLILLVFYGMDWMLKHVRPK